jgi:hypothetical protein
MGLTNWPSPRPIAYPLFSDLDWHSIAFKASQQPRCLADLILMGKLIIAFLSFYNTQ